MCINMNKNIELRKLVANSCHKCDIFECELVYNVLLKYIYTQYTHYFVHHCYYSYKI